MAVEAKKRPQGISHNIYRPNEETPLTNEKIASWGLTTDSGKLLTAEGIKKRTGIERRYRASEGETALAMALKVADPIARNRDEFIAVVVSSSFPEVYPADPEKNLAQAVNQEMGLRAEICLEVGAACSGFVRGLYDIWRYREQFEGGKILFITSEKYSPYLRDIDHTLFCDGSVAIAFEYGKDLEVLYAQNNRLNDNAYKGIIKMPTKRDLVRQPYVEEEVAPSPSGYFDQDGSAVVTAVKNHITKIITEVVDTAGLGYKDIARVVSHQGSEIIWRVLANELKPYGFKMIKDLEEGNWSSGSVLKAFLKAIDQGELGIDDLAVLAAFGAGKGLLASTAVIRLLQ